MWGTRQDGGPRPALLVVASGRGTRGAGLSPVLAEKPAALLTRSWGKAPPVTPARGDALLGAPQSLSRACSLSRQHGLMMTSVRRAGDAGPGEEPNGHSSRPRRAHSLAGGSRAGGGGTFVCTPAPGCCLESQVGQEEGSKEGAATVSRVVQDGHRGGDSEWDGGARWGASGNTRRNAGVGELRSRAVRRREVGAPPHWRQGSLLGRHGGVRVPRTTGGGTKWKRLGGGGGAVQTASPLSRITEQGVLVEDVDFQPPRAEGCVLGTPPARVLEPEEPSGLSLGGRACLSLSVTACEQLSRVLLVSLNQESLDTQSSQHRPETRPAACIPHPRLARSDGASGAAPEDAAIPSGHRLVFTSLSMQL